MANYQYSNTTNKDLIEAELVAQGLDQITMGYQELDLTWWFTDNTFTFNPASGEDGHVDFVSIINAALSTSYTTTDQWVTAEFPSGEEDAPSDSGSVMGQNWQVFEALPVQTTTSTSFTNANSVVIDDVTTFLPVGKFKTNISFSWNRDTTGDNFECRYLFDGSTVCQDSNGLIFEFEPKDSAGTFESTGSDQKGSFAQTYFFDVTSEGTKAVQLNIRSETGGNESSIWDCTVEIYRVK